MSITHISLEIFKNFFIKLLINFINSYIFSYTFKYAKYSNFCKNDIKCICNYRFNFSFFFITNNYSLNKSLAVFIRKNEKTLIIIYRIL